MLMNGKEVNHLVIGGETFDKSYSAGVKAKVIHDGALIGVVKRDGSIYDLETNGAHFAMPKGRIVTVISRYKDAVSVLYEDHNERSWMSIHDLEFIDTIGGVNSPFYLLLLYLCIIWLALGVLLLC